MQCGTLQQEKGNNRMKVAETLNLTSERQHTPLEKKTFPVTGMSCAACASSVETILGNTSGVLKASVNFADSSVLIEYDKAVTPQNLQQALQTVGFDLIVDEEDPAARQEQHQKENYQKVKQRTIWSAILTLPVFILGMFYMNWLPGRWISLFLSIPILFWFGRGFFSNAFQQARHGKANMDTLVALSTGIAFLFSLFNTLFPDFWILRGMQAHVYYEAATVIITFVSLGKLMEEKAKSHTSSAIKKLMGLQAKTVKVVIDGSETEIPVAEVRAGDTVLVRPGEKIPVDGKVSEGHSYVNESTITGEPIPVAKMAGERVFAGTINEKGSFYFIAEKVGSNTLLAQIIKMVREAQGSKAPVQKLVDKIAGIFVPTVMLISIFTFATWMLIGGNDAFTHALFTAIAVLVIACPCALGLATPTAIMVGIGKGAEHNILIKDAESLELGHKVNAIVLDKTGTITEGKPTVTNTYWVDDNEYYKQLLLAIESRSEHPLAEAVVQKLGRDLTPASTITHFQSITGKGVVAKTSDDQRFIAGNQKLLRENNIKIDDEVQQVCNSYSKEGKTVTFFADEEKVLAVIAFADKIKAGSKHAIAALQERGLEVYLATGDNALTAKAVAHEVGIEHFSAEVLPSDKADLVKALQSKGKVVAMVGDGINDSQALAQADVSIAMGKGSDIAMDVARMTLITSDLQAIPKALRLSGKTVTGIRQNLFWAFIYNLIGIPVAAGILFPYTGFLLDPMIAGAAMAFSSVSVVANSLRLKVAKL